MPDVESSVQFIQALLPSQQQQAYLRADVSRGVETLKESPSDPLFMIYFTGRNQPPPSSFFLGGWGGVNYVWRGGWVGGLWGEELLRHLPVSGLCGRLDNRQCHLLVWCSTSMVAMREQLGLSRSLSHIRGVSGK
jgi:hypothetical protein